MKMSTLQGENDGDKTQTTQRGDQEASSLGGSEATEDDERDYQ